LEKDPEEKKNLSKKMPQKALELKEKLISLKRLHLKGITDSESELSMSDKKIIIDRLRKLGYIK